MPSFTYSHPLFHALAVIESGENDRAIGRKGEVSRYQILPSQWKRFYPLQRKYYENPVIATEVSRKILADIYCHQGVDALYTQWNTGRRRFINETGKRFKNLYDHYCIESQSNPSRHPSIETVLRAPSVPRTKKR